MEKKGHSVASDVLVKMLNAEVERLKMSGFNITVERKKDRYKVIISKPGQDSTTIYATVYNAIKLLKYLR